MSFSEICLCTTGLKDTIGGIRSTATVKCSTKRKQTAKLMLWISQKATRKIKMQIQQGSREQEAQEESVLKAQSINRRQMTESLSR